MMEIQPRFVEDAMFIAVDIGDGVDLGELNAFSQKQGYPWAVGRTNRETLKSLDVTVQSTKIAIDAYGVIIYRAGYGKGTAEDWISVFERLIEETET